MERGLNGWGGRFDGVRGGGSWRIASALLGGEAEGDGGAGEVVVGELGWGGGAVFDEGGCEGAVVVEVVGFDADGGGVVAGVGADHDGGGGVFGAGAFAQAVVADECVAAMGEVDEVAGGALRAVVDFGVDDFGGAGAGFDVVAGALFEEITAFDAEQGDVVDVDAVGAEDAAETVAQEAAVADGDAGGGVVVGEDAVLAVLELHVFDGEVAALRAALGANAGAVLIGDVGAGESEVADGDVVALGDEERLALAGAVRDDGFFHARAFDDQVGGVPDGAFLIEAGGDADMVAVLLRGGGGGECGVGVAGADIEDAAWLGVRGGCE